MDTDITTLCGSILKVAMLARRTTTRRYASRQTVFIRRKWPRKKKIANTQSEGRERSDRQVLNLCLLLCVLLCELLCVVLCELLSVLLCVLVLSLIHI